tara:strand:+ start:6257 stop:7180 length:924 start_codon:yes stop_codon:yes gene_type:complete
MKTIEKAIEHQKKAEQELQAKDSVPEKIEASTEKPETDEAASDYQTAAQVHEQPTSEPEPEPEKSISYQINLKQPDLEQRGFLGISQSRTQLSEHARAIKHKLIQNAFGPLANTLRHANVIMVTSSHPGEGKTFTSINLALSIAQEQDKKVLLVDADVVRPSIHQELNFSFENGLVEYLSEDRLDVADIIYQTNIKNLKVMPAGQPHHLSAEYLSSTKMRKLAEDFAKRYADRIVILDSPPLLGVNETAILSTLVGQVVFVVEEKRSKVTDIEAAKALLPEDIACGFVVNKSSAKSMPGYRYGYGAY